MEDGLELSLGLSLGAGGSSGKSKGATDGPVEPKAEPQVEESSSKAVSQQAPDPPFAHYYQTNAENQEHSSKQRHSPTPPFGNFWAQHGGSSAPAADVSNEPITHQSQLPRYQDGWNSNNNGKYPEENNPVSSKRKLLSEETSFQKKHHASADQPDAFSKCSDGGVKNAPISISTDDGSTGENEDVVDSEAEGSNSWIVAQREDSAKGSVVTRGSDIKRSRDEAAGGFQGKRQPSFSGSESSSGKLPHGNSLQASNVVAVPYQGQTQASVPPGIINTSNFPPISSVQFRPPISNGPAVQATGGTGASQVAFGYPTGQLPILETGSSWAFGTPPQAISFTAKQAERAGAKQADDGKKPQEVGASSAHVVGDKTADRVLPLMGSAIRPGIAPNVKFGGSGSYPDLPWVSTTGTGPNGRTISGVTYNFGRNEVKIVCACHGTHMAPEEFIRHASADATGQENNSAMPSFPPGNQAASAQN